MIVRYSLFSKDGSAWQTTDLLLDNVPFHQLKICVAAGDDNLIHYSGMYTISF